MALIIIHFKAGVILVVKKKEKKKVRINNLMFYTQSTSTVIYQD